MAIPTPDLVPRPADRDGHHPRPLWNAASGRFDPVRLRGAIVARAWTVREFAVAAGVSRACLYKALGGRATSDRTAIAIATALASRETLPWLSPE